MSVQYNKMKSKLSPPTNLFYSSSI